MYIANLDNPKCSSHKPAATASQWPAIRSTDCNETLPQRRLYICITLWVPERSIWHSISKVPLGLSVSLISKVKISKLHSDVPTLSKINEQWLVRSGVKRRFCQGLSERQTCVEIFSLCDPSYNFFKKGRHKQHHHQLSPNRQQEMLY